MPYYRATVSTSKYCKGWVERGFRILHQIRSELFFFRAETSSRHVARVCTVAMFFSRARSWFARSSVCVCVCVCVCFGLFSSDSEEEVKVQFHPRRLFHRQGCTGRYHHSDSSISCYLSLFILHQSRHSVYIYSFPFPQFNSMLISSQIKYIRRFWIYSKTEKNVVFPEA